jgi:ABC-type multidrug transport system fused ATPase/permease subunit
MKQLLLMALKNRQHRALLILTLISMCLLTLASQMEIVSIGVITQKGADFFELFAPVHEGAIIPTEAVSKADFQERWDQIDLEGTGLITKANAAYYLEHQKSGDLIGRVTRFVNKILPISDNIRNLVIVLICVAFFKAITLFMHRYSTRLIAIRISRELRQNYFEHIQSLPMSFYQQHNIGSLSSRVVGDAAMIAEAVNACLVNYIQTPFTVITTLTWCFMTSWQLSMIVFFGFPLIIFPIAFLARRVKRLSKQIQQNQERFASVLIDFLAGIQTVKVFAMEEFSLKKYRERNDYMADLEQRSARYDLASRPIVHTIAMFLLATALLCGLYVLHLGVSDVLVFSGLLYVFYEPIKKFAEENSHIQRGAAAAERMFEVMNLKPQIEDAPDAMPLKSFEDSIEFDNVWFSYGEARWALRGLSFKISKGQTVAIVGPTGAGKSSIVQLLPRLYDIQKGQILFDGKPLKAYTQRSLRELIAFVPQRPFLFVDTVAQNISFGRDFSKEQIRRAAQRAHADEFIEQLPLGYDTELAEGGKNFSGGQQQRMAIARALVKNAPILVMDEATSSLDAISEHRIKLAIQELHGSVTQIIIAHRLSTIEDADKIIYVEKGEKIAEGTREELLQSCAGFRRMWEMMMHQQYEDPIEEAVTSV